MGLDWNSLWGQATEAADKAWDQVEQVGIPALQSSLEQWGIDVLTKQNKETQARLEQGVAQVASEPAQPGTFGYYLGNAFETPIMKQYGGLIVAGVVGLVFVGMVLKK